MPIDMTKKPEIIPGKVALIDGDILAYYASGSKLATSKEATVEVLEQLLDDIMYNTRAESSIVIITGDKTKGDRVSIAVTKPYKGNRKGAEPPEFLQDAKDYLSTSVKSENRRGILTVTGSPAERFSGEADDVLIKLHTALKNKYKPIICTADKDLLQAPGWHYDLRSTAELYIPENEMGTLELLRKPSYTAIKGTGWLLFWSQMLTGDTADNIPGAVRIGAVKAYDLLKDVKTNLEAMDIVLSVYKKGYKEKWHDVFIEQYKLLALDPEGLHKGVPSWMDYSKKM